MRSQAVSSGFSDEVETGSCGREAACCWRSFALCMERKVDRRLPTDRRRPRPRVPSPSPPMRAALVVAAIACQSLALAVATTSSSAPGALSSDAPSDFVSLYYKLYWESPTASNANDSDVVTLPRGVPDDVIEMLQSYSLAFDTLPSLLQRAVLWDAGYVLGASSKGELATVFTDCERAATMADIALSAKEIGEAQCSTASCSSAESEYSWLISKSCDSATLLESIAKCASTSVEAVANADVDSIWSTGSGHLIDRSTAPDLRIFQHNFVGASADSVLSIHSASVSVSAQINSTESSTSQDQLCVDASTVIIPCMPYSASSSMRWCRPESSLLLIRWLSEYAAALGLKGDDTTGQNEAETEASESSSEESAKDELGVAVNANFHFDGQSSDLAQQFYRRHIAGDEVNTLTLSSLPKDIQKTLEDVALHFTDLPALLQRGLVWDSGYVFASDGALAEVYTACGLAMSDLAIPTADIQSAGCITQTCSIESNGVENIWRQAGSCDEFEQLATVARCAIAATGSSDISTDTTSSVRIWADGGNDSCIPEVTLKRVQASDAPDVAFALHVGGGTNADNGDDTSCPSTSQFIIPCAPFTEATAQWCRPKPGGLVKSWLLQVAKSKKSITPGRIGCIIGIPVAVVAVFAASAFALRYRSVFLYRVFIRRRQSSHFGHSFQGRDKATTSSATVMTPDASSDASGVPSPGAEFLGEDVDPFAAVAPTAANEASSVWVDVINTMQMLLDSPDVCDSVIAFQDLKFHHLVGRGSCGEVWLCLLHDKRVAAKRLLKKRRKCVSGALEGFANEILLAASVHHPHIVRFIGVASSTLNNLWLVSEYMETGDLQQCLRAFGSQLSWRREKLAIAIGVARALCYLHHDLHPAVVHGDVESHNVLLSARLEAKLGDFGRSRRCERGARAPSELSAGGCAPLWTAPEVLQSRALSPKADMYALGVLLCELDALAPPLEPAAADLPPLLALQRPRRPQLSPECPPAVAALVAGCLQREPGARPNAVDAVEALDALRAAAPDTFSL